MLIWLADAQRKAGDTEQGLVSLAESRALIDRTQMCLYQPEAYWLTGETLLQESEDHGAEAEAFLRTALEAAQAQEAKAMELRAATSLSRVWRQQGKEHEAHALLAPICDWFTEGLETPDLEEAHALLGNLA